MWFHVVPVRERPPLAKLGEHSLHRTVVGRAARMDALRAQPAARREVRPELERQDAHRVSERLERTGRPPPVRVLDGRAIHPAEPRVRDELVRPREDRDRVELHRADAPQHRARIVAALAHETLGVEREHPRLRSRELARHAGRAYQVAW